MIQRRLAWQSVRMTRTIECACGPYKWLKRTRSKIETVSAPLCCDRNVSSKVTEKNYMRVTKSCRTKIFSTLLVPKTEVRFLNIKHGKVRCCFSFSINLDRCGWKTNFNTWENQFFVYVIGFSKGGIRVCSKCDFQF